MHLNTYLSLGWLDLYSTHKNRTNVF